MDVPVTLSYAPVRRRSRLRLAIRALACVAVISGLTWAGLDVRRRVRVLENAPGVGPVDWPTVLTSWTLMNVAWGLSSNPKADLFDLCGASQEQMDFDLKMPIRYEDGSACFNIRITNRSTSAIIVPPLWCSGRIPFGTKCMGSAPVAYASALMGAGVEVLPSGCSVTKTISFVSDPRPSQCNVSILMSGRHNASMYVHAGPDPSGRYPYGRWEDVPASAIEAISFKGPLR